MQARNPQAARGNICLPEDGGTVIHKSLKLHVRDRRGKNRASSSQDLRRFPHRFCKVSRDCRESSNKKITEVVALKSSPCFKTVLKNPGEQRFVFGERNQAVPDVSRWQDVELFPQPATGTAIVRDRHDRSKVSNCRRIVGRCR